jgi:hypothetical protein
VTIGLPLMRSDDGPSRAPRTSAAPLPGLLVAAVGLVLLVVALYFRGATEVRVAVALSGLALLSAGVYRAAYLGSLRHSAGRTEGRGPRRTPIDDSGRRPGTRSSAYRSSSSPPTEAPPGSVAGGTWLPDPYDRATWRYWDGTSWTDQVAD